MVILAPLAVTALYAALLVLAFGRVLRGGDPKGKQGEPNLADLWSGGQQKRILTLTLVYLAVALVGGIVGSVIAFGAGDRTFAALAWASFLGQMAVIVGVVVIRRLISTYRMRHL